MVMTSNVSSVDTYAFTQADAFLIDANVWISLHVPQEANRPSAMAYSRAFAGMLRAKCSIFLDVLVLSEFVNRYARLVHAVDRRRGAPADFKAYRSTPEFRAHARAIADAARRILKHARRIDSGFGTVDTEAVLTDYESRHCDLNDQLLADLCRKKGLTVVTHDADFVHLDVPILTANRKLLV